MSTLSFEKIIDNPKETSFTVSPLRETGREEIETEEEEESHPLHKEEIVQKTFSVESLCNINRLNEHLEAYLNRDIVK